MVPRPLGPTTPGSKFSQYRFADFLVEIARRTSSAHGSRRNAAITLRGIGLAEGELGRIDDVAAHPHDALAVFLELDLRLDVARHGDARGRRHLTWR